MEESRKMFVQVPKMPADSETDSDHPLAQNQTPRMSLEIAIGLLAWAEPTITRR
jgi:hypothetical protein